MRPDEGVEGEFAGAPGVGVCLEVGGGGAGRNAGLGGIGGVAGLDGGGVARVCCEDSAIRTGFVVAVTACDTTGCGAIACDTTGCDTTVCDVKSGDCGIRSICRNTCALHHAIVSKCSFTNSPSISSICIYTILWFNQIHDDSTSMSHFSINADATFLVTISERAVRQSDVS